jgi:manganese/zinc/iron transport system permease protein
MLFFDAALIAAAALVSALFCILFFKEFTLVCFDAGFAAAQGWPVGRLDLFMMTLVVTVTVIGLQAVGLILVVSLLIIPPTAARFWTDDLRRMLLLSGVFGAVSGLIGSGLSALMANLPAGAVIVLAAAAVFGFSMLFGTARGLIRALRERSRLRTRILRENLLRELYEWFETAEASRAEGDGPSVPELLTRRSWSRHRLVRMLARFRKEGLISVNDGTGGVRFTDAGKSEARGVVRKHRLWETYLITHADTAPGHVDWGADAIEHVLDAELVRELERRLETPETEAVPESPHALRAETEAS